MTVPKRWFVLVGGVNGAGKSTFAQSAEALLELEHELGEFQLVNPDLVVLEILREESQLSLDEANLRAAVACEARVKELIQGGTTSFAIETVLSTDKYKPIVEAALACGYGVLFVYVLLGSVEEAIARVGRRVGEGGHDVPEDRIRRRWPRSLANVEWFWTQSTRALIFYNGDSVEEPELVAHRDESMATEFPPVELGRLLEPL